MKDEDRKVRIYAVPFMSFPISMNEESLRSGKYLLETDMSIFTKNTYKNMQERLTRSKIDMWQLRLIIDFDNGEKFYLDTSGVAIFKNNEYYILPWLLIYLWSVVTYHQETAKGKTEVTIRL